ncbi:hypothetical protein V565_198770 [Rhizoctonia solani 123E]|uniref:Uncharacterized protein n=1 Tax=Rhizoctonia solani 123E TaxID=1423351 RepID=A0A074RM65_9AGAM|nr:hypothetical protein V565_198770 [Rhizoctonia solani 123E]
MGMARRRLITSGGYKHRDTNIMTLMKHRRQARVGASGSLLNQLRSTQSRGHYDDSDMDHRDTLQSEATTTASTITTHATTTSHPLIPMVGLLLLFLFLSNTVQPRAGTRTPSLSSNTRTRSSRTSRPTTRCSTNSARLLPMSRLPPSTTIPPVPLASPIPHGVRTDGFSYPKRKSRTFSSISLKSLDFNATRCATSLIFPCNCLTRGPRACCQNRPSPHFMPIILVAPMQITASGTLPPSSTWMMPSTDTEPWR